MRLFHFSEDPSIEVFMPRTVKVPAGRAPGREWLDGPLVWAIGEWHSPMYLFPRDCPRILVWPLPTTTPEDLQRWWGQREARMIAHIEWRWLTALQRATIFRYELPTGPFEDLQDAGMWVSREEVRPLSREAISDLLATLCEHGVELRVMHSLAPLRDVWSTSLHASGLRLRNARDWTPASPPQQRRLDDDLCRS